MNKSRKLDRQLLIYTIILLIIGLIMMFSASNIAAMLRYHSSPFSFLIKQGIWFSIAFIISFFVLLTDTKKYYALSLIILAIFLILLVVVLLRNQFTNNARSWIKIGKFSLQPSEIIKIAYIIWASCYYNIQKDKLDHPFIALVPLLGAFLIAILIFIQPDFGTSVVFLAIAFFLFIINPISKKIKKPIYRLVGLFSLFLLFILIFKPDLINKLPSEPKSRLNLHNFCSKERYFTDGNQMCNSLIAFNSGGLIGKGFTKSSQKYLYLPDSHTDFIFPIIVEELGAIGGIIIIILYMLMLYRIIIVGKNSLNNRNASICYAIAFYLFIHIFFNIGGVSALIPITGVPLPLLSYGGSFNITVLVSLFIVQRISIENNKNL